MNDYHRIFIGGVRGIYFSGEASLANAAGGKLQSQGEVIVFFEFAFDELRDAVEIRF